jgi:hypothetical protein
MNIFSIIEPRTQREELKAVIRFSNQLVENLDAELNEKNLENIRVGLKLIEVSDEMKDIYAKYLQNHANITLLLKNVKYLLQKRKLTL